MMFLNLGLGLKRKDKPSSDAMETDQDVGDSGAKEEGAEGEEDAEDEDDLYKDQPIIDTVIEDFSLRLGEEDIERIVNIMRKHLGNEESS